MTPKDQIRTKSNVNWELVGSEDIWIHIGVFLSDHCCNQHDALVFQTERHEIDSDPVRNMFKSYGKRFQLL